MGFVLTTGASKSSEPLPTSHYTIFIVPFEYRLEPWSDCVQSAAASQFCYREDDYRGTFNVLTYSVGIATGNPGAHKEEGDSATSSDGQPAAGDDSSTDSGASARERKRPIWLPLGDAAADEERRRVFAQVIGQHAEATGSIEDDLIKRLRARYRYLLPETRRTLFERARWFYLSRQEQGAREQPVSLRGRLRFVQGGIEPIRFRAVPRVVLFEWEQARAQRRDDDLGYLIGFLLLDTVIDKIDGTPFDDFLEVNLRLRYLETPSWNGYASQLEIETEDGVTIFPDRPGGSGEQRGDQRPGQDGDSRSDVGSSADGSQSFRQYLEKYHDRYWPFWRKLMTGLPPGANEREGPHIPYRCGKDVYVLHIYRSAREWPHIGPLRGREIDPRWGCDSYPDDRAFVYTFACIDGLEEMSPISSARDQRWTRLWHSLLDVDGAGSYTESLSDRAFDWLADRTYDRWVPGTIYGYTNFSAAMLVRSGSLFAEAYYHFLSIYFDQLLLVLYLRVALFCISNRISVYSAAHVDRNRQRAPADFRWLRHEFTTLMNLYQFPMFTTQYQGLEMYELMRRQLDIDEIAKEVETEVRSTDELLSQEAQEEINQRLDRLQNYGLLFAVVTVSLTAVQVIQGFRGAPGAGLSGLSYSFHDLLATLGWAAAPPLTVIGLVVGGITLVPFAVQIVLGEILASRFWPTAIVVQMLKEKLGPYLWRRGELTVRGLAAWARRTHSIWLRRGSGLTPKTVDRAHRTFSDRRQRMGGKVDK